jgi:hypothetical protein
MEQTIPSEANSCLPSHEKRPEFYRAQSSLPCSQETVIDHYLVSDNTDHTLQSYRIPVGARFSAPIHAGPEAHPSSCTMGTVSFPGVSCDGA